MLQDVRTVNEALEIGKSYLVPCVKAKDFIGIYTLAYSGLWLPIIGTLHDDPQIALSIPLHYHPDWRFVPEEVIIKLDRSRYGDFKTVVISKGEIEILEPVLQQREMLRHFEFPSDLIKELEPLYLGKKTGCRICPHRQVSLAGLTPRNDGTVICPGHGLRVIQATGEVVPRFN